MNSSYQLNEGLRAFQSLNSPSDPQMIQLCQLSMLSSILLVFIPHMVYFVTCTLMNLLHSILLMFTSLLLLWFILTPKAHLKERYSIKLLITYPLISSLSTSFDLLLFSDEIEQTPQNYFNISICTLLSTLAFLLLVPLIISCTRTEESICHKLKNLKEEREYALEQTKEKELLIATRLMLEKNISKTFVAKENDQSKIIHDLIYNSIKLTNKSSINVKINWEDLDSENSLAATRVETSASINMLSSLGSRILEEHSSINSQNDIFQRDQPTIKGQALQNRNPNGSLQKGRLTITFLENECEKVHDESNIFKPFVQTNTDLERTELDSEIELLPMQKPINMLKDNLKVDRPLDQESTSIILEECQAITKLRKINDKKEFCTDPNLLQALKAPDTLENCLLYDIDLLESMTTKSYMMNLGMNIIKEVNSLEQLWKYLNIEIRGEALLVFREKHIKDINGCYNWDPSLWRNKLVFILKDPKNDSKIQCDIAGAAYLKTPVNWNEFLGVLSKAKNTLKYGN